MFSANAYAARRVIPFRRRPPTPLQVRAALQLAFIAAVWWTAIAERPNGNGEG